MRIFTVKENHIVSEVFRYTHTQRQTPNILLHLDYLDFISKLLRRGVRLRVDGLTDVGGQFDRKPAKQRAQG